MLTELKTLAGDSSSIQTRPSEARKRRRRLRQRRRDTALFRLDQIEVSIGDFVRHGEHHENQRCSLLDFIADNGTPRCDQAAVSGWPPQSRSWWVGAWLRC